MPVNGQVSCPKCGNALQPGTSSNQVLRVSAADVVAGPAAADATMSPGKQSFQELGIPSALQTAVTGELTVDEKVVWLGRPSANPALYPRNPAVAVIAAVVCLALAAGIWLFIFAKPGGPRSLPGPALGFLAFFTVALLGFAAVFVLAAQGPAHTPAGCRSCYVLTNRRALVASLFPLVGATVKSWTPDRLLGFERIDAPQVAGAGDLVFGYDIRLAAKTGSLEAQQLDGTLAKVPFGFLKIENVRAVEKLLRDTLLLGLERKLDA